MVSFIFADLIMLPIPTIYRKPGFEWSGAALISGLSRRGAFHSLRALARHGDRDETMDRFFAGQGVGGGQGVQTEPANSSAATS